MGGVMVVGGMARTASVVKAQQEQPGSGAIPATTHPLESPGNSGIPDGPMRARMEEERKKLFDEDRRKRLEKDVDKLVALSNELKTVVDKANKDELSLDAMRKAAEIEKLAHDVQSRMKN